MGLIHWEAGRWICFAGNSAYLFGNVSMKLIALAISINLTYDMTPIENCKRDSTERIKISTRHVCNP
jgi:hypothetical protein